MTRMAGTIDVDIPDPTMTGKSGLWTPQFGAGVFVLLTAALFLTIGRTQGWLRVLKLAAPIRRPLEQFSTTIGPFRLTLQPRLKPETEQELGTHEYASWRMEDTSAPHDAPWRVVNLSVTYYTGKADQVPHVPDECLYQGGREQVGSTGALKFLVPGSDRKKVEVPVRSLLFRDPNDGLGLRDFYTIRCNTDYYDNRDRVRLRMADVTEKHLFYSKVELAYSVNMADDRPDQFMQAARHAFETVLPALESEFWPDWESIEPRGGANPPGKSR